jgi:hypothetical protein
LELNLAEKVQEGVAYDRYCLGRVFAAQDDLEDAATHYEAADAFWQEADDELMTAQLWLAQAELEIFRESFGKAVSLATGAERVFARHALPHEGARAWAMHVRALLSAGRINEARRLQEDIRALESRSRVAEFEKATAAASLLALTTPAGTDEAVQNLRTLARETTEAGFVGHALQARFALGEVELRIGIDGARDRLAILTNDAERQGFKALARRSRKLLERWPS